MTSCPASRRTCGDKCHDQRRQDRCVCRQRGYISDCWQHVDIRPLHSMDQQCQEITAWTEDRHNKHHQHVFLLVFLRSNVISALTLLVGCHEGHLACKKRVVRYWHGYLSAARCKWLAYGPADATATPIISCSNKIRMVYLSSASLPRLSWKKGR